jgi:hypothetical protein
VVATYRLAVQEAATAPELAQAIESGGRTASLAAVIALMEAAIAAGLLAGAPAATMAVHFLALLMKDMMVQHLLGLAPEETEARAVSQAEEATVALLRLYRPG